MEVFKRIFFVAILAGLMAGIVQSAIMQWRVVPLILEAELYEISEADAIKHEQEGEPVAPHKHEISEQDWTPQDGFERIFYTVLATILTAIGFTLIMAAISTLIKQPITTQNGLLWGLAGFISFNLMPAIGLPPELPGMIAAELGARQIWWWGTVLASAISIIILLKYQKPIGLIVALILFLLPHIIGAPIPPTLESDVPAHLATSYAANALFTSLSFWLTVGWLYGFFNKRIG